MVSSPDDSSGKSIDPTVGGLVWVRRRNGSWWPGRIMSMDELPEDCLVSPRSGTPVKLLGRDDASVDWYNLEKSKRVKAFRCGEYDDCIQKAKAAASANKKAVKYARREDAILHALEIESAQSPGDLPDFISARESSRSEQNGRSASDSPTSSDSAEEDDDYEEVISSEDNISSVEGLSQSGTSFEEPDHVGGPKDLSRKEKRQRTPDDSEDEGVEGAKRMRGLEDLGIGLSSKRKAQSQAEGLDVHAFQDGTGNSDSENFVNRHPSSQKRKRILVASVREFLKRKSRRRTLRKVLESSALVTVPVMCSELDIPGGWPGIHGSKAEGLQIVDNSKEDGPSELSNFLENFSVDGLHDVLFVRELKPAGLPRIFASWYGKPQVGVLGQKSSQGSHTESMLMKMDGNHESLSTSLACLQHNISQEIENSPSMWQSKGKRNTRHATKHIKKQSRNSEELDYESDCYIEHLNGSSTVAGDQTNGFPGWRKNTSRRELHMRGTTVEVKRLPDHSAIPQKSLPYRQSRFRVHPKLLMSDYETTNTREESALYDVSVEVKASYRPQHVPIVSLMSKLNGKAIIGHPLTVEALDDGSCDELMNNIEWYPTDSNCELDDPEDDEPLYNPQCESRKPKHSTLQSRPSPGKSSKTRRSALLSKKTRKLSSLTGLVPGLQKSQKGPAIACVPLKVVFSRLKEAVSGSVRPVHHG